METFSGLGLLFSEILILNSQPQGSCQGPGGFCSEVQLWDRKSDQLWPPWGSATNHGFEQHRSVPSDVHFCEQFASLFGGRLLKCVFFFLSINNYLIFFLCSKPQIPLSNYTRAKVSFENKALYPKVCFCKIF